MNHKKGYATAEEAMRSKAYLTVPGATLDLNCPCTLVHVDLPRPAPYRDRNSGPTPKVRALVLARDGYACVRCGRSVTGRRYSLGHRLRAAHGGKPVASNLLTFDGLGGEGCHGDVDLYRDPEDEAKGYRLRSGQNPLLVPVTLFSPGGRGERVLLDDEGGWTPASLGERAA